MLFTTTNTKHSSSEPPLEVLGRHLPLEDDTEVTTKNEILPIKIRFKYLENGQKDDNLTTTLGESYQYQHVEEDEEESYSKSPGGVENISNTDEDCFCAQNTSSRTSSAHINTTVNLGIKRKLSYCSSENNEDDEILDGTLLRTQKAKKIGLDYSASLPAPSSYSPTHRPFPQPRTTTESTGMRLSTFASQSSSPKTLTRKLRIVHDRYSPFRIDKLLEAILSYLSLSQLKTVTLVSQRWHLFARNRLNQLMFFTPPYDLFSSTDASLDGMVDIQEAVCGLEKIKDVVNQRLLRLSQIRRHRLTARFLLWRDNGPHKLALPSPPPWAFWLHTYGFPLSEFRTYTVDEVFHWIMNNYQMDDKSKEEWSSLIMKSNVVAFVFRPLQGRS